MLVYPGGDWEVNRPTWEANRIDFAGRRGFIKLALDAGVPIVPVVSVGGQETAIFLTHGERLAKLLRLDKLLRLKTLPVNLSLPWIVNIGDFLGHLPLPAKITVQVMDPIDLRERYGRNPGPRPDLRGRHPAMQDQLDELAAERQLPVSGRSGVRIEQKVTVDAPRHLVWEYVTEPANYPVFMEGLTRWDVAGDRHTGLGARYRCCSASARPTSAA